MFAERMNTKQKFEKNENQKNGDKITTKVEWHDMVHVLCIY